MSYSTELINKIEDKFTSNSISINNIKFKTDKNDITEVTYSLAMSYNTEILPIIKDLYNMEEIVEIEKKLSDE